MRRPPVPWIAAGLAVVLAGGVLAAVTLGDDEPSDDAGDRTTLPTTSPARAADPGSTQPPAWQMAQERVAAADSAADLVVPIWSAESAIRAPGTPDAELDGWADVQQAGYRTLARHPEWEAEVVAALEPDGLGTVAAANADAFRELWALTEPRDQLPDWRIVAPPPAGELLGHYRAAGAEFGVGWEYLAAIHLVESRMGRIRGASSAGARGPMQFLPSTWEAYGEGDIEDPGDAIRAAARYLVDHGAPANMQKALFAYNHSDRYVSAVSTYAELMREDEAAYLGFYHWDVYYRLKSGDVVLPVGWDLSQGTPS